MKNWKMFAEYRDVALIECSSGKTAFRTEKAAERAGRAYKSCNGDVTRPYLCKECKHFHLTRNMKFQRDRGKKDLRRRRLHRDGDLPPLDDT